MVNRRAFLQNLFATSIGLACPPAVRADERNALSLRLAKGTPITVPRDFTGLGYEMSSVAKPGLLRVENRRYVELIRGLGKNGVIRVGGIVANYTRYEPNGNPAFDRHNTVITQSILEEFAEFLSTIGWSTIWSVNFAQGTVEQAVEEARAVAGALGRNLLALEIGNEVDDYGKGQPFRPPSYSYADYRREYEQWHVAIARAVPGIRFAAPDTAQSAEWLERMAQDARGQVQLLTTHYYRNGQAHGDAEQLALPDPRLGDVAERLRVASRQSGIPWRMCEMNSFSGGGRRGVSDTFLGALWTLNVMLYLAQSGCAGVNIETGVNQLGFVSSYSPIQDNGLGVNSAGVPYYGMLAFATAFAGCDQMFPLETLSEHASLAAYVMGAASRPRSVVVVNTNQIEPAQISIKGLDIPRASLLRLTAAAGSSTSGVTFAGAEVNASNQWHPAVEEQVRSERISVPAMSAAIVIRKG